jgi:hypothetical protein
LSSPLGKLTMMLLLTESLLHLSYPTRWLTCRGNQPYRKMTGAIPGQVKPDKGDTKGTFVQNVLSESDILS